MTTTAITTVIPTFRRPKLLRRAIESVLAQSAGNFKLCIYDNASGDETESVVSEYARRDQRVLYTKNAENIGVMNNFTQAIEAVTTDFYSVLSDDDFLLPGFYESALREFACHSTAGFVCAPTVTVNLVTKKWHFRNTDWRPGFYEASPGSASQMHRSHFTLPGVVFRTAMRSRIGPMEQSGDDCLHLTIAASCSPFVVTSEYGAVFTFYDRSYSAATGLRGGDNSLVYDALLSTVQKVLNLDATAEQRVYTLMLVLKSYGYSFEFRRLHEFVTGQQPVAEVLPSLSSMPGILSKICGRAPRVFHPLLRYAAKGMTESARVGSRKSSASLLDMPKEVYAYLTREETDLSPFLEALRTTPANEFHRRPGSAL